MTAYYEYSMPVKLCAGDGALEHIPYELDNKNASKPLVLTDKGIVGAGLADLLRSRAGKELCAVVFDDVPQDSGLETVEKAAAFFRENGCDSLIALGGGSVLDTAKGVCALITQKAEHVADLIGCEEMKRGAYLPFIAVPTTSGTGSEATSVAVIADHARQVKLEFITANMQPDVAILDPALTEKLPLRLTASTAADALCHAIEAFSCRQKNPVSDAFALTAVKMICDDLPVVIDKPSDKKARLALATASFMAGAAFSNSMVGAVHGIGHALGGVCGVPHGDAMAILLPAVMRFNLPVCGAEYKALLPALAGIDVYAETAEKERAAETVARVTALMRMLNEKCGLPVRLSQTGRVEREKLDAVCEKALNDGAMLFNPKEMSRKDVLAVLDEVF